VDPLDSVSEQKQNKEAQQLDAAALHPLKQKYGKRIEAQKIWCGVTPGVDKTAYDPAGSGFIFWCVGGQLNALALHRRLFFCCGPCEYHALPF